MRDLFYSLFLTLSIISTSIAANANLDLSHSHSVGDLHDSGLHLKEMSSGIPGQAYIFQSHAMRLMLPTGRSLSITANRGRIDTDSQKITRISITGYAMPQDQAYLVASQFFDAFELDKASLESWHEENKGRGIDVTRFSISVNLGFYPRISLAVLPSMNYLYPCVIRLLISWDWRKHHDWDENRAWRELPEPPAGLADISLNPPSGKVYDLKDAYNW